MVAIVRYSTRSGPDNQKIHRITHNRIKLNSHGVTYIDLTGIVNMHDLQRLDIANNRLEEIDLTPIAACKEVRYLDLSENRIREIDLTPLEECSHLERLDLSHNELRSLDISPLHDCTSLRYLYMHDNLFKKIDVSVLLNCPNIEQITLNRNGQLVVGHLVQDGESLKYYSDPLLDYALREKKPTWLQHEKLKFIPKKQSFSWLVNKFGWEESKQWMSKIGKVLGNEHGYPLQLELLRDLGIPELACYDGDFADIVQMLPDKGSFKKGLQKFRERLLRALIKQLKNNGSTLFFNIDKLSTQDASILIPMILKRRKKELNRVTLIRCDEHIDLTPLWKTGYGFEILNALGMKRTVMFSEFSKVKKAFTDIGVKISLTQNQDKAREFKSPDLSPTLCKYVIPAS